MNPDITQGDIEGKNQQFPNIYPTPLNIIK
jgi:hypothetical protein